jgi:hypothetical protein
MIYQKESKKFKINECTKFNSDLLMLINDQHYVLLQNHFEEKKF